MTKAGLIFGLWTSSILVACSGPPSPSSLKDEPFCADFELGVKHTKMRGSLRQPVMVKVKDGKRTVATIPVYGLSASAPYASLFLLPDGNTEYAAEFYQCPNERAPVEATSQDKKSAGLASYTCGESSSKPYATVTLATKKGDANSRILSVPEPPITTCWKDENAGAEPAPEPSATASATAAP